jgi:phospholipid/cholesterol/gamma-HCH transport system permease protein
MHKVSTINNFLSEAGDTSRFIGRFFVQWYKPRYEIAELFRQCFVIGYKSLPLVGLTAFIMGLVLTMQLRPAMIDYGVESQIPVIVGISIIREIGPVITALIFAGKIGSSIGAELGSMKVTEQIDAMEVSGTNPFKYLVVSRVMAATLMLCMGPI